ncbi:MAG: hypothetical protein H0U74_09470 [Bradymonadaceae bacterium]|nr:hypothetical protein [Lujinxingiaceae bacterium]
MAPIAEKAAPNSFVALIPVPWGLSSGPMLGEVHGETWLEVADYEVIALASDAAYPGQGQVRFEHGPAAQIIIEEPIEQLVSMAAMSREPFTAVEAVLLKEHAAIWRVTMLTEREHCLETARRFARIVSTFVEAGAPGVFLPFSLEMHSPGFIKQQAVDLEQLPAVVNLFVAAWNQDKWMMTRGLTVFGLPELETLVDEGLNAAYFCLMDVASAMIAQQDAYPPGSRLQIGPKLYQVAAGPLGPRDEKVPICGAFGVLSIATA